MAKTKKTDINVVEEKPAEASDVARFRVLRNIQHGKTLLTPGTLVDMSRKKAQHLVHTNALAPHVVERPVTVIADATGAGNATVTAIKAEPITGTEQEAANEAAASQGLTEDDIVLANE